MITVTTTDPSATTTLLRGTRRAHDYHCAGCAYGVVVRELRLVPDVPRHRLGARQNEPDEVRRGDLAAPAQGAHVPWSFNPYIDMVLLAQAAGEVKHSESGSAGVHTVFI